MRLGIPPKKSRSKQSAAAEQDKKPQHISSATIIGQVSLDLTKTIYEPLIREVAAKQMEDYAVLLAEHEDAAAVKDETSDAEIGADGSTVTNQSSQIPPEPLFSSTTVLHDLLETLQETSDHFFPATTSKTKVAGGYKVYANAAKFERMLDEKYGILRPFITQHPQIERTIRSLQRQYSMGQWSPIRNSPPPIPRSTSIIILFMMQRGGMQWQVLLLTSLLLIVGLQPWALVGLVALGHTLIKRRKHRAIGGMSSKIPQIEAYYHPSQDNTDKQVVGDATNELDRRQAALLTPVGSPLSAEQVVDTSNFDTIILGHGPGTLFAGSLLSRAGRKVLILSPRTDASGCLELEQCTSAKYRNIPFDVEASNVSKISKMQQLLAPALATKTDYQGGIRFAQIGCEADGYAFEVLDIPGVGADRSDQSIPFVLKADGAPSLMNDAATSLGDGWPDYDGGTGNSTVGAYLLACEAMNASASAYYVSKIIPDNVNSLRTDSQFYESAIRHTAPFLNKCFPVNTHVRSLMAGIGMKGENIKPSATSMAAHVSNVCAVTSGEGMHYPIGGPRALGKALANVIERSGGQILTGIVVKEFVFDLNSAPEMAADKVKDAEEGLPPPRCIGVKLQDGREICFDNERYVDGSTTTPAVVSCVGLIDTFIRLLDEDTRTKYKVPRGLPALSERRPVFKILYVLTGTADELELTGADFYRLPNAAIAKDRVDESGEIVFGEIGGADIASTETGIAQMALGERVDKDSTSNGVTQSKAQTKGRRTKFQAGESWLHIAFPSAKDPSFDSRHGNLSTCVVTIEADDDFVTAFDTKPKLFFMNKETAATPAEIKRLLDRVTKDLLDTYPQVKGKIEHAEVRGPFQRGLSHNPERYAAKGVRPETPYPRLFVGGSDLTVGESFAGEAVAGWLVANQVIGYSAADHLFLQKNLTTDLERFLESSLLLNEDDVAVPCHPRNTAMAS
ncbi:hypothetical protein MPSEU_001094300 [Mayamaea pseudoterrestris]|nr:hypothetical protein MPSEU_001094300 [Mayamaea pseudoterrestris]